MPEKVLPRITVKIAGQLVTVAAPPSNSAEPDTVEDDPENLMQLIARDVREVMEDVDAEDAPDWEFSDGEKKSADKTYTFCPSIHRGQILRLFTKHFVRHPLFPHVEHPGDSSADSIRRQCAYEMYQHCFDRGLTEVWAYMWNCWYAPSRWVLWARSASERISRLRTTMTVENHWKVLKHHFLTFLHRPRLDRTLYTIITQAIPHALERASRLEDHRRAGRG